MAPRTASYTQTHSAWHTWCAAPGNAICCAFHVNCAWWDWQCSRAPSFTHTGNCQPGVCHSHLVGLLCSRMRNPQPTMEALPAPEVMLPSCSCSPPTSSARHHTKGSPWVICLDSQTEKDAQHLGRRFLHSSHLREWKLS